MPCFASLSIFGVEYKFPPLQVRLLYPTSSANIKMILGFLLWAVECIAVIIIITAIISLMCFIALCFDCEELNKGVVAKRPKTIAWK